MEVDKTKLLKSIDKTTTFFQECIKISEKNISIAKMGVATAEQAKNYLDSGTHPETVYKYLIDFRDAIKWDGKSLNKWEMD